MSVFSFQDNNFSKYQPNLVCALILWRSALGLLMGKFCPFLTELSAHVTSIFYFHDNNLSKSKWIFTKFDMCIYIVEICFWIAHLQISSVLSARDMIMAGYYRFRLYFLLFFINFERKIHKMETIL